MKGRQESGLLQCTVGCGLGYIYIYIFNTYRNHHKKIWWHELWQWNLCLGSWAVAWSCWSSHLTATGCPWICRIVFLHHQWWMESSELNFGYGEVGRVTVLHTWVWRVCGIWAVCMHTNRLVLLQFSQIGGHRRPAYYHSCCQLRKVRHCVWIVFQYLWRTQKGAQHMVELHVFLEWMTDYLNNW